MPLVLEDDRSVTNIELALPAATAETIREYTAWVQERVKMTADAATTATADFALRQVFRRDRLWQEHRKNAARPECVSPPPAERGQPPSPASLPPPVGTKPIPNPGNAIGGR